uniref:Uncharacterized protein n=1 Tax=Oryza meridionalis TaxID=40149 RepID=A0A0E0C3G4_9ORYZ
MTITGFKSSGSHSNNGKFDGAAGSESNGDYSSGGRGIEPPPTSWTVDLTVETTPATMDPAASGNDVAGTVGSTTTFLRSGEPSSPASAIDDRSDGEEIQGGGFGGFWWVAGLGGNDGLQRPKYPQIPQSQQPLDKYGGAPSSNADDRVRPRGRQVLGPLPSELANCQFLNSLMLSGKSFFDQDFESLCAHTGPSAAGLHASQSLIKKATVVTGSGEEGGGGRKGARRIVVIGGGNIVEEARDEEGLPASTLLGGRRAANPSSAGFALGAAGVVTTPLEAAAPRRGMWAQTAVVCGGEDGKKKEGRRWKNGGVDGKRF